MTRGKRQFWLIQGLRHDTDPDPSSHAGRLVLLVGIIKKVIQKRLCIATPTCFVADLPRTAV